MRLRNHMFLKNCIDYTFSHYIAPSYHYRLLYQQTVNNQSEVWGTISDFPGLSKTAEGFSFFTLNTPGFLNNFAIFYVMIKNFAHRPLLRCWVGVCSGQISCEHLSCEHLLDEHLSFRAIVGGQMSHWAYVAWAIILWAIGVWAFIFWANVVRYFGRDVAKYEGEQMSEWVIVGPPI